MRRRQRGGEELAQRQGRGAGALPRGEGEREGGERKTRLSKKRKEREGGGRFWERSGAER